MAESKLAVITVLGDSGGPVDPGFGHGPGLSPIDPGFGVGGGNHPWIPGSLPSPPPGMWPPPSGNFPILPAPPGTPPGAIWPPPGGKPPVGGVKPPDTGTPPGKPPVVGGGPVIPSGVFWIVAGIPGVGWRYVCVDPSLDAGMPLPPTPTPKA